LSSTPALPKKKKKSYSLHLNKGPTMQLEKIYYSLKKTLNFPHRQVLYETNGLKKFFEQSTSPFFVISFLFDWFLVFLQNWGLNSEPHACQEATSPGM
jgi:hypothetical protein